MAYVEAHSFQLHFQSLKCFFQRQCNVLRENNTVKYGEG